MSLILSPEAIRDLQSIATYTFHAWGAKQETIYLRGIWRKLEEIRDFPQAHPLRKDLLSGCAQLATKNMSFSLWPRRRWFESFGFSMARWISTITCQEISVRNHSKSLGSTSNASCSSSLITGAGTLLPRTAGGGFCLRNSASASARSEFSRILLRVARRSWTMA